MPAGAAPIKHIVPPMITLSKHLKLMTEYKISCFTHSTRPSQCNQEYQVNLTKEIKSNKDITSLPRVKKQIIIV